MLMQDANHLQPRATLALLQHYQAGMPQLALYGLSENWLLKECAHLHWMAIARAQGRDEAAFSDIEGRRSYAALTAVRLHEAQLDAVAEHAPFALLARLVPHGRAQHFSAQTVRMGNTRVARIELLSALVRREPGGGNRSVARTQMLPGSEDPMSGDATLMAAAAELKSLGRAHRTAAHEGEVLRSFDFTPCPNSDFNGAGFLYFATFQALVDRAEFAWYGLRASVTAERTLYFHGNIDPGEAVRVELLSAGAEPDGFHHRCRIVRRTDGLCIADVITRKRFTRRAD
ncbi:MAG: Pnap_2097 family protein [Pseudomonadota bacterium]